MNESIAVIVPTYNRALTLRRSLDSVYSQNRKAEEVCIVDDGSSDGTEDLIAQHYPRATYIKQENKGVSAARNAGVAATVSQWIAFLDSDDEWFPEKLATQLAALGSNPEYRLVHSDEHWIRNGRRVNQMKKHRKRGGDIFNYCLPLCVISPSAVVLHRSLFAEAGGFDESLPACEDYDLWLRICSFEKVLYIDEPLLNKYGGHKDQLSKLHWGMDRFRVQSLAKLLEKTPLDGEQARLTRETLIEKATILKNGALKRDNFERARHFETLLAEYGE